MSVSAEPRPGPTSVPAARAAAGRLGPAARGRRRTPRRAPITAAGTTVLLLALAAYAVGVWLGYPLLLVLAVGLAVMTLLASMWVVVRPPVSVGRTIAPDRVEAGKPVLGRLEVRNRSRLPAVPFVAVDRVGPAEVEVQVPLLRGGGRRAVLFAVPPQRRGRYTVGPLTIERRDPLALFRRADRVEDDTVLWVHPRVHPAAALPVGIVPDYEGRSSQNPQRGTVTFSSLREYVPGDDPRQIHWRSSARRGELMVREHIDTTEPTTTIVLDADEQVLPPPDFDAAAEVAASLLWPVQAAGRPVALTIVGADEPVPSAGADVLSAALDRLAAARPRRARAEGLLAAVDAVPAGGSLVVITGDVADVVTSRLAEQRRRFNPVVVVRVSGRIAEVGTRRRPGLAVISAPGAVEAVRRWNSMAGGEPE